MGQDREYELKFTVRAEDWARIEAHPILASALREGGPARLNATYFDTPDGCLSRRGISLRVRENAGRRVQTLKRADGSLLDRGEWEAEAEGEAPSLDWLATTPLRRRFRHGVGKALAPSFTVEVERSTLAVAQGTAAIVAALDQGEIRAGSRTLPVCELELELKRGEPAALFDLSRILVADLPLVPSLISKAERGTRLLDGSWGYPAKGRDVTLRADAPTRTAVQAAAEAGLHQFMLNAAAFAGDPDIEAVHQARVGLRRLRAAVALFKPILADDRFARVTGELKWMSGLLGAARDLDVFQSHTFDPAAGEGSLLGGPELAAHMRDRQRAARAVLAEALGSVRWRIALDDLLAWLADGAWRRSPEAAQPLAAFAVPRLRKRRARVVRMGRHLNALSPHDRHRLRIEAKKLRYGLDFFAATPGIGKGSACAALAEGLAGLQSSLGALHDHEARSDLLRTETAAWGRTAGGASDERATFAAGALAAAPPDAARLMAAAAKAYRKVRRNKPF